MKKYIALIIGSLCLSLYAAPQNEAQKILEREQQRTEQERIRQGQVRNQNEIETFKQSEAVEPQAIRETNEINPVFLIKEIAIVDNSRLLSQNEKFSFLNRNRYTEMGINELNRLINEVNAVLVKKGFITSRVIANTDKINEGSLKLEIVSGKINKVILNDDSLADKLKIFFNRPSIKKGILNIRDIDTLTDNFNKNSSNDFTVRIEPSEKEGHSNLNAGNKIKGKTEISIGYNNHGDEQGGQNRLKLGLSIDSPLGINDHLAVNIQGVRRRRYDRSWKISPSASLQPGQIAPNGPFPDYDPDIHGPLPPERDTKLWNVMYRIPFREYQMTLNLNKSIYRRSMYSGNTIYDLSGSSTTISGAIDKILYRNNRSKLTGNIGIKGKNTKSYFEDVRLTDRNLTIGSIGLKYDFAFLGIVTGLGASYSKGLRIFHAEKDLNKGTYESKAEAEKYNLNFHMYKPIKNMTLRLTGEFQGSSDVNYSAEKISVGGIGSVPGYNYEPISGDRGYSLLAEISYTFRYRNERLVPYIQYGMGETKDNHDTSRYQRGKIRGGSIGLRYSSAYFDIDVAYAKPFGYSEYMKPKNHEVYASFNMKYNF